MPGSKASLTGLHQSADELGFCLEALGETLGSPFPVLGVCLHSMASGTALKTHWFDVCGILISAPHLTLSLLSTLVVAPPQFKKLSSATSVK